LKELIEKYKGEKANIQWLKIKLKNKSGSEDYYILHMPEGIKALDEKISRIFDSLDDEYCSRAGIKSAATAGHNIFSLHMRKGLSGQDGVPFITASLRRMIVAEKMTGIRFEGLQSS
jgi:hypothetical protein